MTYETHSARAELEHAIAAAIDLLDLIDPDPDYEETGDLEPSLSGNCLPQMEVDLEGDEHDGVEPDEDFELSGDEHEPSLGSLTSCYAATSQTNWAGGAADDREDEHDGAEPDTDGEPSLGSLSANVDQELWSKPHDGTQDPGYDLEADDADDEPEELDDDGDLEDGDRSDDDPIFPSLGAAVEREAHEMRRVASFIEGRCRHLIGLERQAVRQ